MQSALRKMFYEYLGEAFQRKLHDELFEGNEQQEVATKNKKKNKKKKKNKNAAVAAQT